MSRILWKQLLVWKQRLGMLALICLTACAAPSSNNSTADAIRQEIGTASQEAAVTRNKQDAVNSALLPPLAAKMPEIDGKPVEAKFDITVNNTEASQVFMAIVSGTRYSMLINPDVAGSISLNLKDVTVFEALEVVRDIYGYDYKVEGSRIYIQPITLQTRLYQVNYLTGQREGKSSLRVASGSITDATASNSSTSGAAAATSNTNSNRDSSKVSMTSSSDFWDELSRSLTAIVGNETGRSVVISPMSGVIVVRAMPDEQKNVAAYLKASQISVERQVNLEAKIIEVQLSDSFQSGINWAAFRTNPKGPLSVGQMSPGASLATSGTITDGLIAAVPGSNLSLSSNSPGSLVGLAFQTSNFAGLLSFLESQGNVHVLSSPRIATLNNQKAVLKVGVDEFFVTEVSGGTATTTTAQGTAPTVRVQPFFSGIALDVTPRIDENNEIILHVHPSVSQVSTVNKVVNLGGTQGFLNLPLASSSVSETDSIVRVRDGQIVAIGGLMRQATIGEESGLPGLSKRLFGRTSKRTEKRELVILIKPTVVNSDQDWADDISRSSERISKMMDGSNKKP